MNLDKLRAAAAFIRADAAGLTEADRAALLPLAQLLDFAGSGHVDPGDLGEHLDAFAAGLLYLKATDERTARITEENATEHTTSVVALGYLWRWECTCKDSGIAVADKVTANTGADRHVSDKLAARLAEEPVPVA